MLSPRTSGSDCSCVERMSARKACGYLAARGSKAEEMKRIDEGSLEKVLELGASSSSCSSDSFPWRIAIERVDSIEPEPSAIEHGASMRSCTSFGRLVLRTMQCSSDAPVSGWRVFTRAGVRASSKPMA